MYNHFIGVDMNTKHLSILAALTLSIQVIQPRIVDNLNYTKADLRNVQKAAAVLSACDSAYSLFAGRARAAGLFNDVLGYAKVAGTFTDAALEDENVLGTLSRLTQALEKSGTLTNILTTVNPENNEATAFTADKLKQVSGALVMALAKELGYGFATKNIKNQVTNRLYRRALYVARNVAVESVASMINDVTYSMINEAVGAKKILENAGTEALETLNRSLLEQVVGEILVSNAQDDGATQEIIDANEFLNKLSGSAE